MPKKAADDRVTVKTETKLHMAEHERLLAFNGDSDAMMFDEWWAQEGRRLFAEFVDEPVED